VPSIRFDSLFKFAEAGGVKVIYSFRLDQAQANNYAYVTGTAVPQAEYILNNYAANLDCFALGNEPGAYTSSYGNYEPTWYQF
jgi:hypothetical protein